MNKILFPIDFTENQSKILPYVLWASENFKSSICLIHVVDDTFEFAQTYSLAWDQKKIKKDAENTMNKICEKELQGCPSFQRRIAFGDPATTILQTIESEDIDLVIMGTHGRKGLEHTLFGSVAGNVVKRSTVPVLTINPYTLK
ncbi:MAG: universal stress protein [Desulfosarcina sp.]|nr:universal stress protein [Desulfosarcina sp.]